MKPIYCRSLRGTDTPPGIPPQPEPTYTPLMHTLIQAKMGFFKTLLEA